MSAMAIFGQASSGVRPSHDESDAISSQRTRKNSSVGDATGTCKQLRRSVLSPQVIA